MTAAQTRYHSRMAAIFYPDCYGLTRILLTNHPDADPVAMDTAAYDLAEALGVELTNYRLSKVQLYSEAENRCLLFLLLGVEMALVISTLLYSEAGIALEQDRYRYGLLQALGLSDGRVFLGQLWQAFLTGLLGLLGANLALGLVLVLAALFTASPRLTLTEIFEAYPWGVHGLVCGAELLICTLLQTLPILRFRRVQPIENIRS
jgi:ABC-type lipoprotein release transport system permease subunit